MIKDVITFIFILARLIGYGALLIMEIFGLDNYWLDKTTSGYIACIISMFVIVYVITEVCKLFEKE